MRTPEWSVKRWSSAAGWSCLAVATIYLTFPLSGVSAPSVHLSPEVVASCPVMAFDHMGFDGESDAVPE